MLSNTIASPFNDFFCLRAIESKNFRPPTKKENRLPWKTLKPLSFNTQNPKVRNLLHKNLEQQVSTKKK